MNRAAFFDIDGTLIDASRGILQISSRVKDALHRLQESGCGIFIATGRPYAFLPQEIKSFGFDGFILMNGALVMHDDIAIFNKPIPRSIVKDTRELCDANDIEYVLEGKYHSYLSKDFKAMEGFYESYDIPSKIFTRDFEPTDVYKMEFYSENERAPKIYKKLLKDKRMTGLFDTAHERNFEYYSASETKGTGVLHMMEHLDMPRSKSFGFGDGVNDVDMMGAVGIALAMGNGHQNLKDVSSHVIPSVSDDGVAVGIERYILGYSCSPS